jgi:hypothetical protein
MQTWTQFDMFFGWLFYNFTLKQDTKKVLILKSFSNTYTITIPIIQNLQFLWWNGIDIYLANVILANRFNEVWYWSNL